MRRQPRNLTAGNQCLNQALTPVFDGPCPGTTELVLLSADRLAPGLARCVGDDTREIDLILARHADAFEFHFVGTAP
jgi:hypothetical protein